MVVWYSHLYKNFPKFVVIHTVKGFSIVNEAEVDVFLEFSYFFYEWFYEDLEGFSELTPPKKCPFHYRGQKCKSRKSRNTCSNRQI